MGSSLTNEFYLGSSIILSRLRFSQLMTNILNVPVAPLKGPFFSARRLSTRKPTSGPVVAPAAPVAPKAATCGVSQVQADDLWTPGAKIVGGVKAAEDSWPWICALVQNKPGFYPYQFCGATIVSNTTCALVSRAKRQCFIFCRQKKHLVRKTPARILHSTIAV